jgi:branched-chain amino acid transport system ATP-binding protein/branched-chain amino acid transport system permease protein
VTEIAARTEGAIREAVRELGAGWTRWHSAGLVLVALAALLPAVAPSWVHVDSVASGFYLALSATGLWLCVGLAGMPSLGQGAFMGIGAFTVALLTAKAGSPMLPAVLAGVVLAAVGGVVAGIGVVRLRPAFIAVTTWILAWGVSLFLLAFPGVSGGAEGIVVPSSLSVSAHYEFALGLLVAAIILGASLARGSVGIELRAVRQRPAAAAALGVPTARRRLGAFVASAAIAGLAGGLEVQLAGVADGSSYGPYLSFRLLAAVLIGGAVSALGPSAGLLALALVTGVSGAIGSAEHLETARFNPMLAALLLLAVLAVAGDGIVPSLRSRLRRGREHARPSSAPQVLPGRREAPPAVAPVLVGEGLTKRFDSVTAADSVSLGVGRGEICALIGPNGSGKTTVLRLLAGALEADAGRVLVEDVELTTLSPRAHALHGLVRTLQSTAAFVELTALENVLVGAGLRREHGGAFRTAAATPLARSEDAAERALARAALAEVGLEWAEDLPAGQLSGPEQRLLGVAAAIATRPRVLMLDEPSAGASMSDLGRIASLLARLRERGLGILLVEHNLRLVGSISDRVYVMAAGAVIAAGSPSSVAADREVRAAYLGRAAL